LARIFKINQILEAFIKICKKLNWHGHAWGFNKNGKFIKKYQMVVKKVGTISDRRHLKYF
jgi:hypothetical protein